MVQPLHEDSSSSVEETCKASVFGYGEVVVLERPKSGCLKTFDESVGSKNRKGQDRF
jgi:hypothetical protein